MASHRHRDDSEEGEEQVVVGSNTREDDDDDDDDEVMRALREVVVWPQRYACVTAAGAVGASSSSSAAAIDEAAVVVQNGDAGRDVFRWPHGVLLHGPAGVGKTSAVRRVAREVHRHRTASGGTNEDGGQEEEVVEGAEVFEVPPEALGGEFVGDSERRLREVFASARAAARKAVVEWEAAGAPASEGPAPAVLLLENVDALCPPRSSAMQHETRVVAQMLLLLDSLGAGDEDEDEDEDDVSADADAPRAAGADSARVVVIATTEKPNAIDDALRRPGRLEREIAFPMPSSTRRGAILRRLSRSMPLHADVDVAGIAASCTGYTAADLAALAREAFISAMKRADCPRPRPSLAPAKLEVLASDFERARARVPPSVSRSAASEFRQMRWEEVGGMDEPKKLLRQSLLWPLRHAPSFARLGIRPPRGILLYGPPGCAKTSLALCGATEAAVPFFHLDCASLYSMWVGEGEARLRETFRQARLAAPSIVFLDEIDAALPRRSLGGGGGGADHGNAGMRLLTTLLTEIDGLDSGCVEGVVLLAATNRPWDIDAALMRPGRIDVHCFVPPPDEKGRLDILRVATRDMPVGDSVPPAATAAAAAAAPAGTLEDGADCEADRILSFVSRATALYTGAELVALCREAAMIAVRRGADTRIAMRDFEQALHESSPATTRASIDAYAEFGSRG